MKYEIGRDNFQPLLLFGGAIIALIASIVIVGWLNQNPYLTQLSPNFAPMQFNTALCFLMLGAGLVSVGYQKLFVSRFCSFFVIAFSLLSALQYILNLDLGIDTLFVQTDVLTKTTHVGRMSPTTSIGFILSGFALLMLTSHRVVSFGISSATMILFSVSLLSYFFEGTAELSLVNLQRVAVHTSIGFLIFSGILLTYGTHLIKNQAVDLWEVAPFSIAAIILTFAMFASYVVEESVRERNLAYFHNLVADTQYAIKKRYVLYEQSLRGGLGLFYASKSVEREEWHLYVGALNQQETLPGINGVGYIDYVLEENLNEYLQSARADGFPDFKNHPNTDFKDKFIIKYIEPIDKNIEAVGLDIGFEANRREAAEQSRDFATPIVTRKIQLVQDHNKLPGFLLLVPVYKGKETPESITDRQKDVMGWVYAPFISNNFFEGIEKIASEEISFVVYDGSAEEEENIIYSYRDHSVSKQNLFEKKTLISVAGRIWGVTWHTTVNFSPPASRHLGAVILFVGMAFSILIYFLMNWMLQSRNIIAEKVRQRTQELLESEKRLSDANEELKRSNHELERFAYIASHDLQEPLRKISTFTGMLKDDIGDTLSDEAEQFMHYIVDAATRMRALINGLLEYSRITTGDLSLEQLDLNDIVNQACDSLSERIKENNVTVEYKNLPVVEYDPVMMTQLLQNLIGNAIKYRSERDPVIKIYAQETADNVIVSVSDNGMGIEEKYLDRIFEMFQRLHRAEEIAGTGIGLSLCQKIVERYGGKISADSEHGVGSTFTFTIPKKENATE